MIVPRASRSTCLTGSNYRASAMIPSLVGSGSHHCALIAHPFSCLIVTVRRHADLFSSVIICSVQAVIVASIKLAARAVIKVIAGIAVVVFLVANPIGDNSGIAFIGSIIVLVACGAAWAMLEVFGGPEEPEDTSEGDK